MATNDRIHRELSPQLTRLMQEILPLERELGLVMGGGDLRPRIEYFHDALRALESNRYPERLRVELLAYDAASLRYLGQMPLAQLKPAKAGQELVLAQKANRMQKARLSELYRHYALLFTALFKAEADDDYEERAETADAQVAALAALIYALETILQGKGKPEALTLLAAGQDDEGVQQLVHYYVKQQHWREAEKTRQLIKQLKERSNRSDDALEMLDKAQMQYAMAQLGVYEQSKDALKTLAEQGLNLAGQFVEASLAGAQKTSKGKSRR